MKEPPNSPYLARLRSGQPIVWTMCPSGLGTFQTSLTPSAQICGCGALEAEARDRGAGEMALRALRENGQLRDDVRAGLEVSRAPAPRGRGPCRRCGSRGRGRRRRAASGRPSPAGPRRRRPRPARRGSGRAARPRRSSCRGCASSAAAGSAASPPSSAGRRPRRAPRRSSGRRARQPALEEAAQRARVDDRAGEQMRAGALALLDDRDGNVAEPLGGLRRLLEQLAEPDRAGEPGRPRTDDQDADLDPLVGRIGGRGDRVRRRERRRVVGWTNLCCSSHFRARTPRSASAGSGAGRRRRRSRRTRRSARSGPC